MQPYAKPAVTIIGAGFAGLLAAVCWKPAAFGCWSAKDRAGGLLRDATDGKRSGDGGEPLDQPG